MRRPGRRLAILAAAATITAACGSGSGADFRVELGEDVRLLPDQTVEIAGTDLIVRSLGGEAWIATDPESDQYREEFMGQLVVSNDTTTESLTIEVDDSMPFGGYAIEVVEVQPWAGAEVVVRVTRP